MGDWVLAAAAAGLWVGIALSTHLRPLPAIADVLLLAAGAVVAGLPRARVRGRAPTGGAATWHTLVAVSVAFALAGVGWTGLRALRSRASPLVALADQGRSVDVEGALATDPQSGPYGWSAILRVGDVRLGPPRRPGPAISAPGTLWIEGRGALPALAAGDRLRAEGIVAVPQGTFGAYLRGRGIAGTLTVGAIASRGPPSNPLLRAAGVVRAALRRSLVRALPSREAGLMMGLTIGDTSRLDEAVAEQFRATGLTHLLAVSGENVALFLAPILGLAMLLGAGRRARLAVGIAAVGFFVLLTRAEPSVLRAAAMASLTLLGVFLGRPRAAPALMGGAVLGLLAVDPELVSSVGFQMSVAATAGMAALAGPLADRLRRLPLVPFPSWLALPAGTTIAAQAGVTPLMLQYFGAVPAVTLAANLLAVPAVGPGMLLGLVAGAGGIAAHPLGVVLGFAARVPLDYLMGIASHLARAPLPTITSPGGRPWELAALYGGLVALAWRLRRDPRTTMGGAERADADPTRPSREGPGRSSGGPRPPGSRAIASAAAIALVVAFAWQTALRAGGPPGLRVTFFSVGEGDAALVRSPAGATILIDAGPDPRAVARKLAALGIHRLDLVVATHAHADHVTGLPAVLVRVPVGLLVESRCRDPSPAAASLARAVAAERVRVRTVAAGDVLRVGDLDVRVLGPDRCYVGTHSDPNNDSVVLLIRDGPSSVLFPADAESDAQSEVLRREAPLVHAAVLKVPHHAGDTSLPGFLRAVGARLAVVSVGPNRYGHPDGRVVALLERAGARLVRTDLAGDVTVTFEGGSLSVESMHA